MWNGFERVMQRCRVCAALGAAWAGTSGAQAGSGAVRGQVVDTAGRPIEGTVVRLGSVQLLSSSNGDFVFTQVSAGRQRLSLRRVGYAPVEVTVTIAPDAMSTVKITLRHIKTTLTAVRVEREDSAQTLRRGPYPVAVVDVAAMQGRATDLNELLDRVPGVQVRSAGGIGSPTLLSIRGLEGKRVEVFIDGRPLSTPDGTLSLNDFPLLLVKRIEVYRGLIPAWLGASTTGGAINIVLREPLAGSIDVSLEAQSFGVYRAAAQFGVPLASKVLLELAGFATEAANNFVVPSPYDSGLTIRRDHDQYRQRVGGAALHIERGWFDAIVLEVSTASSQKAIQGIRENIRSARSTGLLFNAVLDLRKTHLGVRGLSGSYRIAIPRFITSLIDTASVRQDFSGTPYTPTAGRGELGFEPNDSRNTLREIRQRLLLHWQPDSSHAVTINVFDRHAALRPRDTVWNAFAGRNVSEFPRDLHTTVVGGTHEWQRNDGAFRHALGVRHSSLWSRGRVADPLGFATGTPQTIFQRRSGWSVSEALHWALSRQLALKGAAESSLRLPDAPELFGDNILITPAAALAPERSVNLSLGTVLETRASATRNWRAEVSLFQMSLSNLIALSTGVGFTSGYANIGKILIRGIDVEWRGALSHRMHGYANATWQDARDRQRLVSGSTANNPTFGLRLPNQSPFLLNAGIEWSSDPRHGETSHQQPQIRLYADANLVGRFFYNWEVSRFQDRRVPASRTVLLGLQTTLHEGAITVSGEIANAFNAPVITLFNQPLAGRAFRLKARLTRRLANAVR